jgi:hypothetical protein
VRMPRTPSDSRASVSVRAKRRTVRRGRTHLCGLAATSLVALPLSGCGSRTPTLSIVPVERAIAGSILTQRHVHANVTCPSNVPRRAGLVFTCTAKLNVGTYPVSVTEINSSGGVRYENQSRLVILDIAKVERAIGRSILSQRRLRSVVTCPAEVIQQLGVRFTCTATIGGQRYLFDVAEADGNGHVRYFGRR